MEQNNSYKSNTALKKNILLNTIFRILMIIAPFLTAPYVSRILLSDGVGVYSYTQSLSTYFVMFAALGTVSYGTREIARKRENQREYSQAFWEIEIISIICSSVCIIGWLILAFCYSEYKIYLLILTISIIATTLDISWFYAGLEKYQYTVIVNLIFKILSVIFIFLFVKNPNDIWIYVLIYSLSLLLGNGSMWFFLPKFIAKTSINKKSLIKHFKETLVYFIPTIAASLYTVLDKTLIGLLIKGETTVIIDGVETTKKISELESGYYEQATKIIDLVKTVSFVSINAVVYSRSSFLYKVNDSYEIKKLTMNTFQIVMFLSIGASFGLIGVSESFVPLFFGDGYNKTALLIKIMAILVPIICLSGTLGSLYYSPVGKRKTSAIFLVIGAIINLLISTPLVIFYKSTGAAIASLIAEIIISILYFSFCKKAITFKELVFVVWKKIIAGVVMLAYLFVFDSFVKSFITNKILHFAVMLLSGFITFVIILIILRDKSMMALKDSLSKLKKRYIVDDSRIKKGHRLKNRISVKQAMLLLLIGIMSGGAITFSYLYGSTKPTSNFYSVLMSLDYKTKNQENVDFLHGTLKSDNESESGSITYNKYLNLQQKTKSQSYYYNSFLVSSNEDSCVEYDIDYGFVDGLFSKAELIEVATFYDYNYMESLGLPLFRVDKSASTINPKNNAQFGAYISASCAENIVKQNGMLNVSNNDLALAFNLLLSDESYVFYISNKNYLDGTRVSFSINNIYLDYDHVYLFNDFQNQVQKTRYGNYSKTFDFWFSNPVFTFSPSIFSNGCSYFFDIRKNYGNLDRFFNNVSGYDFALNGFSVSFIKEDGTLYEESILMNQASLSANQKPTYVLFAIGVMFFIVVTFSFEFLYKYFKNKSKALLFSLPFLIFMCFQIIFHVLLAIGVNRSNLYLFFNTTGNIVSITFFCLMVVNSIIWSRYANKHQK